MGIQDAVFKQLRLLRQVGLAVLDSPKGANLSISLVEEAAKKTLVDYASLSRGAALTQFLKSEVARVQVPGHSQRLTTLFGLRPDLDGKDPIELRNIAADEEGVDAADLQKVAIFIGMPHCSEALRRLSAAP